MQLVDVKNVSKVQPIIISGGGAVFMPDYDGEYAIVPKVVEQVLETKNKTMKANVVVSEIPKTETHNAYGTTITIGGIL